MKIKDCLACKLNGEVVPDFLERMSYGALENESLDEWMHMKYEDAANDSDTDWTEAFLDHMNIHKQDMNKLLRKIVVVTGKSIKEII